MYVWLMISNGRVIKLQLIVTEVGILGLGLHYKKKVIPTFSKPLGLGQNSYPSIFFSRCFKLPCSDCRYRVVGPVLALFKSARKGIRPIPTLSKALV